LVVVDDEPVILELLASVFASEPYDVVLCPTGNDAVQAMEEGGVDVLLADKNLPDVSGLQLVRYARSAQPDAEAIIITGFASLETALTALELGVFDYIVKPPKDIFEVRRKVKQAFERQELARENRRLLTELKAKNEELRNTIGELRDTQAELIQAEKLAGIGTLAAGIAHEISSPLFGVMGLAEAIQDEEDRSLVQQYAADIVEYTRSIKDIVNDLTGYSRTARSEYLTTVELHRVVDDAIRLVTRSTPFHEDRVRNEVSPGIYVNARTNEIRQVFVNLVKNALDAVADRQGQGGSTGLVRVLGGAQTAHVWAEVIDDGPGIPPESQSLIFDPFYTTKGTGRGTGLGLNIVYRIMTKYRGSIQVQSTVGEGTTFHLKFPVDRAPDADAS
jgi:signal transduction histidine kinase